jgi:predicted metal-dependent HD superfamily phosphohydrolase
MWGEFDDARHLFKDPVAVEFALFYHDCIYTPYAYTENGHSEWASCDRAVYTLSTIKCDINVSFYWRIKSIILYCIDDIYETSDSILFKDMDYAILGKSKKEYNEYRANIKKEYFFAPVDYRVAFLKSLLAKRRIYGSDFFYNKYEKKARLNIERELKLIDKK